jgi:hypothetical protein
MKSANSQALKQCTRTFSFILAAWALIGPVASALARARRVNDQPVIRVGIYNYANIAPRELQQAERHATALFAMAGVRIVWLQYSHKLLSARIQTNDPAPDFSVRILHTSVTSQTKLASGVDIMGESIIPRGAEVPVAGGIANIFNARVREVASASGPFSSAVLGEAIAHELGHLMLGTAHSRQGVMKILWTSQDQDLISYCELRFLPGEAEGVRRAARSLQQSSSTTLVAQR